MADEFTIEELEDLAYNRKPMPDLRSQAKCLLFQSFRNLYDYARRVQMSPEQGRREKQEIIKAYEINKMLEDMQEDTNQMWKRIELAAASYAKDPSIENADRLYKAIYRVDRKVGTQG